jgi:hypothetical protein
MSTRFNLPSGGWVELKNVEDLKARDKKAVLSAVKVADPERPMGVNIDSVDNLVVAVLIAWEVPYLPGAALPSQDRTVLDELSIADYDELNELTLPLVSALFPAKVTVDDHQVPDSPTVPESV